jgi:hypothetical protein
MPPGSGGNVPRLWRRISRCSGQDIRLGRKVRSGRRSLRLRGIRGRCCTISLRGGSVPGLRCVAWRWCSCTRWCPRRRHRGQRIGWRSRVVGLSSCGDPGHPLPLHRGSRRRGRRGSPLHGRRTPGLLLPLRRISGRRTSGLLLPLRGSVSRRWAPGCHPSFCEHAFNFRGCGCSLCL